jgi:O-antigen ligase
MKELYEIRPAAIWADLRQESLSFWLICTYLFLEYVRPQTIYPELDVLPFAFLTLLLAIVVLFFEGGQPRVRNASNKLLWLYLLVILLSSAFAYSPSISFANLKFFLAWFIIYYLIIHIVNTEQRFLIFFLSFLLYNFKMSQHGFVSWALIGFQFRNWGVTGGPGWFQNSGEFGIELCVFLPLSIYFIVGLKEHWRKAKLAFFLLLPFTAMASVIATSSRGALIGSAAALFWMVLKSKARFTAIVGIAAVLGLVYSFVPAEQTERLKSSGEDSTSTTRLERWAAGREIIRDYPVLGIGYANWSEYTAAYYPDQTRNGGFSHNIFIDAGSELGVTGLMVFVFLILSTFVNNRRTRRLALQCGNKFLFYTAHGLDAALIGFLVSGSFVSVLYYPYFWINLSLTVALNNVATRESCVPNENP